MGSSSSRGVHVDLGAEDAAAEWCGRQRASSAPLRVYHHPSSVDCYSLRSILIERDVAAEHIIVPIFEEKGGVTEQAVVVPNSEEKGGGDEPAKEEGVDEAEEEEKGDPPKAVTADDDEATDRPRGPVPMLCEGGDAFKLVGSASTLRYVANKYACFDLYPLEPRRRAAVDDAMDVYAGAWRETLQFLIYSRVGFLTCTAAEEKLIEERCMTILLPTFFDEMVGEGGPMLGGQHMNLADLQFGWLFHIATMCLRNRITGRGFEHW